MAEGASAASGQSLAYYYYVPEGGYAPNGNILIDSDYVMGDWYFTYDSLDRIASATPDITAPIPYLNKYLCWTYDVYGNRTMEMASATPCPGTAPTTQIGAYYNTRNQITSTYGGRGATFVYDAAGDTTYDGVNNYWYDAEGRLCAVQSFNSVTQYFYDAEGARVARGALSAAPAAGSTCSATTLATTSGLTLNKRYLVDLGGDQATELNLNGTAATWVHSNIWLAGRLNATYDTNGLHFPLTDALGTKRVQMSAFGTWEEYCTSLPFGNDVGNPNAAQCTLNGSASTADDATEHHFTGKERDTESGNDYFGARYYASSMGRFMSPDWSAKEEPVPYAKLGDPQTLNLYAYLRNNPLAGVDADGHEGPCDINVTIAIGSDGKPAVMQPAAPMNFDLPGMSPQYGVMGAVTFQVTQGGKPLANAPVSESVTNKRTVNGKPAPAQPQTPSQPTDSKGQLYDAIGDTQNTHGADSLTRAATSFYDNNTVSSVTDRTITVQGQGCSASFTSTATLTSTPGQKPAITVSDPKPVPPPPPPKPQTH